MNKVANIIRLLSPTNIVFVGGSNLGQAIKSCEAIGFAGDIWVVNPKYETLAGRPCFASVADLPGVPDAAFVAVNSQAAIGVVAELATAGTGGCVCYAAGFAEMGADGEQLQQQLVDAAGEMALMGPNCYGMLNYLDGAALWPDRHGGAKVEEGVALISQSGNVALNLTMADRSLPIAQVVSVGNQAMLGIDDYIDALIDDPRITAIGLYIEGLKDIAGFSRAAVRALEQGVPIVALKAGTSELGTQLTMSHTSSMAGADEMYNALFRRLGVVRVNSLVDMLETLKLFAVAGPLRGNRLGVLTCSGGDSAMLADLAEQYDLTLPEISPPQAEDLRELLQGFVTISNPLDYNTAVWGKQEDLTRCYRNMLASAFDATVLVLDYPSEASGDCEGWDISVEAMVTAAREEEQPAVVISSVPELLPEKARRRLMENGITPLQGLKEAVSALGAAAWYHQRRTELRAAGALTRLHLPAPAECSNAGQLLDEAESKQLLASFGLTIPASRVVSAAEAPAAAAELGFPVVVKVVSAQLPHKTEAGAVALNLHSAEEVADTVADMGERLAGMPGVEDRFLVEKMVAGTVAEMIIGLKRDPQFGLALVVGSGGILVNLINDGATLLLPTSPDEVEKALVSLKGDKLLNGYRGRAVADRAAIVRAVMAVADFAAEYSDRVGELDVNPLMVLPEGQGVLAADALIRLVN